MGNRYFKKMGVHKYTWVSEVNGEKILIDFVNINRLFKDRLLDMF